MYNGFDFGKTEIFFRLGLDKAETQAVADLPVGQITLVGKGIFYPSIVIPGRANGSAPSAPDDRLRASPESMTPIRGYGFRACAKRRIPE